MNLSPRMLGLAEWWEPRFFFIQDFTPVNTCCLLYDAVEKQRESQHLKKFQDLAEQNLPK